MDESTEPAINPSIEMSSSSLVKFDVSEEDKENFLKSVLADKPYEETYDLFDGRMLLRFRNMTVQENTDVVNQVVIDKEKGIASDTDAYFITIATYRLGVSLMSIDGETYSDITKSNFSPSQEAQTYVQARAEKMKSWSTTKLAIFLEAFKKFESKVIKLSSEVMTPNFWKASA